MAQDLIVRDGDTGLHCRLFSEGDAKSSRPGVLVFPDLWGCGAQSLAWAARLASLGYVALAVDMFGARVQANDLGHGLQLMQSVIADRSTWRGRARSVLDALATRANVDDARIGAVGFCFGGSTVLELARSGAPLSAGACLHGEITSVPPTEAAQIRARLLICTGAADPLVPLSQVTNFADSMTGFTVDWQVLILGGAGHSFTNPDAARAGVPGVAYDSVADARAWDATTALFTAALHA